MQKEAGIRHPIKLPTAMMALKSGQGAADIEFASILMASPIASTSDHLPHRFFLNEVGNV
ncbi:hypothetical protein [Synechococcus sp. BA-132 BA5]|uniref:hypothetical protein n=1 Tax=Synechococcus sp. BA-132 BA5 TaxID=3110252 RepID=UPI002B1F2FEB|nr:hypothetical protein [Synechococcus sp. BA-132 BA5]